MKYMEVFLKNIRVYYNVFMNKKIPEFKYFFSMNAEWQQRFLDELRFSTVDNKIMHPPDEIGNGVWFFTEITANISVLVVDFMPTESLRFTRVPDNDDFWIIYYDLSDGYNSHIVNQADHRVGYKSKLGFAIVDNKLTSSYVFNAGERAYSLRFFIRKKIIQNLFKDDAFKKIFKKVFSNNVAKMFYYGYIDSRSRSLLFKLRQYHIEDYNYEFLLKSVSYNLLGLFFERLSTKAPIRAYLEKDVDAIVKSQQYLLADLLVSFPGVDALAEVANMSVSKYLNLYKNIFEMTPGQFFKNEKFRLAKELLESGEFKLISDVAFELGYNKTAYFSSNYKEYFGTLPSVTLGKQAY